MRTAILAAALAGLLAGASPLAFAEAAPETIAAALADPTRPAEDVARDAARHPAELLAFAGVEPGDTVVDFLPGGGYFTRLFSNVVGAEGKVYAWVPKGFEDKFNMGEEAAAAVAGRANAERLIEPLAGPVSFSDVDVVWTAQNYHDLHTPFLGNPDVAAFNKLIFDALKPGGVFIVVDHVAAAGSGVAAADALHRIDPAIVKAEVEAAGFVFEGESAVLANPADTHDILVFDEKIRGKTDQFVYRFRKPAS